jgi:ketosteroid isomerase-like protein
MGDEAGVRDVVVRFVEALNQGDDETVVQLHSEDDDALAIGTDPDEWFQGAAGIREAFGGEGGGGLQARIDEPLTGTDGDVGWYATRGAFVLPDGREVGFRATGVCRREDGEWRIFHSHTSIPVTNEEALEG